jgi:hypothetical protein
MSNMFTISTRGNQREEALSQEEYIFHQPQAEVESKTEPENVPWLKKLWRRLRSNEEPANLETSVIDPKQRRRSNISQGSSMDSTNEELAFPAVNRLDRRAKSLSMNYAYQPVLAVPVATRSPKEVFPDHAAPAIVYVPVQQVQFDLPSPPDTPRPARLRPSHRRYRSFTDGIDDATPTVRRHLSHVFSDLG